MRDFFDDYLLFSTLKYTGFDLPLGAILFGLTLGLSIAALAVCFQKRTAHLVLRRLLRAKAFDKEGARTLRELRLNNKALAGRMLSGGGKLRSIVRELADGSVSYEELVGEQKQKRREKKTRGLAPKGEPRFYIPEESVAAARRVCEEGAPSVLSAFLSSLLILFFGTGLLLLLPTVFALI